MATINKPKQSLTLADAIGLMTKNLETAATKRFPQSSATNVAVGTVTGSKSPFSIGTSINATSIPVKDEQKTKTTPKDINAVSTATIQQTQPTLNLANEEKYLRGIYKGIKPEGMSDEEFQRLKNWAVEQGRTYGIDITQPTLQELRTGATEAQKAFIESGVQSQITGLEAGRQKALGTLEQQRGLIAPQYQALRTQASNQAMQQARNLAEYMAARGQATSGLRAQQELQMGAELQGRFGQIGLAEQQAIQNLENRKTEIGLDYDTKISQAKSEGERQKESFELQQKLAEIDRIEKEMLQKIQDAKDLEQQKIETAAAEAKDEADFQRRKELITYETNESIRAAQEKAKFDSTPNTSFKQNPEYSNYLNEIDSNFYKESTLDNDNKLQDLYRVGDTFNQKAIQKIQEVRNKFGLDAAKDFEKYFRSRLDLPSATLFQ